MTKVNAKVVLDSISPNRARLITVEARFHRFILAELNTHRVFSRNSASSRAIPVTKQISMIREDTAVPVQFGTARSGMQSGPPLQGRELREATDAWLSARDAAVFHAEKLLSLRVHKEVVNRLLEPYMWHVSIITSTEWENFFNLRRHPDAQPEIQVLANAIYDAIDKSTPTPLDYDEWHTPYIQPDEDFDVRTAREVSAGRCARVSYLTHDGIRDPEKDISLFTHLKENGHASPTEHVATPLIDEDEWGGNFRGWLQLRQVVGI